MDELHTQVVRLQNHFKDCVDQPNAPIAISIRNEMQRLEDDLQAKKHPGSIEGRVEGIIRMFESIKDSSVLDYNDISSFRSQFEAMKQTLRRLA